MGRRREGVLQIIEVTTDDRIGSSIVVQVREREHVARRDGRQARAGRAFESSRREGVAGAPEVDERSGVVRAVGTHDEVVVSIAIEIHDGEPARI